MHPQINVDRPFLLRGNSTTGISVSLLVWLDSSAEEHRGCECRAVVAKIPNKIWTEGSAHIH